MTTDKHLFGGLIYVGPQALTALMEALCDLYGDHGYGDEDGIRYTNEPVLADFLFDLARTGWLRIVVIERNGLEPSEEFVLSGEVSFGSQSKVDPAEHETLVKKLHRGACIYATVISKGETIRKGGAQ